MAFPWVLIVAGALIMGLGAYQLGKNKPSNGRVDAGQQDQSNLSSVQGLVREFGIKPCSQALICFSGFYAKTGKSLPIIVDFFHNPMQRSIAGKSIRLRIAELKDFTEGEYFEIPIISWGGDAKTSAKWGTDQHPPLTTQNAAFQFTSFVSATISALDENNTPQKISRFILVPRVSGMELNNLISQSAMRRTQIEPLPVIGWDNLILIPEDIIAGTLP